MSAPQRVSIVIDGAAHDVPAGIPLGAVLHALGSGIVRRMPDGSPRGLFCGMGLCFDCLVSVDGHAGVRACVTPVRDGMRVERDLGA
jgi:predicted molibdopterin-dependent oxidoreductase YjgC